MFLKVGLFEMQIKLQKPFIFIEINVSKLQIKFIMQIYMYYLHRLTTTIIWSGQTGCESKNHCFGFKTSKTTCLFAILLPLSCFSSIP